MQLNTALHKVEKYENEMTKFTILLCANRSCYFSTGARYQPPTRMLWMIGGDWDNKGDSLDKVGTSLQGHIGGGLGPNGAAPDLRVHKLNPIQPALHLASEWSW
jgi:hypothetical protein